MNAYNYAVKFQRLLWHPDEASIILTFTTSKKHLTMLGLTALSKWTGCYDRFKSMRENLGLKWSVDSGSEAFRRLLNESKQIEDIGQWLDQTSKLGDEYSFPIAYMALTGLRPAEACLSLSTLAEKGTEGYFNKDLRALEHFRFNAFLRGTKNAYLSFLSDSLIERASAYAKPVSLNQLRKKTQRAGLPSRFGDLRKAWARRLRDNGVPQEQIDLLQGRISRNVFTRFYYRPNLQALGTKVLEVLEPLEQQLLHR
jgi:hypothetical protein